MAISFCTTQVAVHFADLHDTPARMVEKGVIRYVTLEMHVLYFC